MAQAMASMAGLRGASQAVLEGTHRLSGPSTTRVAVAPRSGLVVKAQQQQQVSVSVEVAETSRRAVLGLVAVGIASGSFVQAVFAEAEAKPKPIPLGPPPPPSGGLPGTENADEARDFDLPLKNRFFLQPLPPAEAAARAKDAAQDIINVKPLIEKKAWPYVQNNLRSKAEYLRYDLNTVMSAMDKDQKKSLKELTGKLFEDITNLDYAAKKKSSEQAEKYYAETVATLNDVLAKLG